MATRDWTRAYVDCRRKLNAERPHPADDGKLLTPERVGLDVKDAIAPSWVNIVEIIRKDINKVKTDTALLQKLHGERLRITFGADPAKLDENIDGLADQIGKTFKRCKENLPKIATIDGAAGSLRVEEQQLRLNAMRSLTQDLEAASKAYNSAQKYFLTQLASQQQVAEKFFPESNPDRMSLDDAIANGMFTPEQVQQLEEDQKRAQARSQEIRSVAKQIEELADMFKQLSALVIEQGTVVDRIDYNVECALENVLKGNEQLKQAEQESKKSRMIKCMILLVIIIIILLSVFIYRKTH